MHRLPYLLGIFPPKRPTFGGSFAQRGLQLKASYAYSPPCSCHMRKKTARVFIASCARQSFCSKKESSCSKTEPLRKKKKEPSQQSKFFPLEWLVSREWVISRTWMGHVTHTNGSCSYSSWAQGNLVAQNSLAQEHCSCSKCVLLLKIYAPAHKDVQGQCAAPLGTRHNSQKSGLVKFFTVKSAARRLLRNLPCSLGFPAHTAKFSKDQLRLHSSY